MRPQPIPVSIAAACRPRRSGCTAGFGALLAELFPTELRRLAMGTSYNLARTAPLGAPVPTRRKRELERFVVVAEDPTLWSTIAENDGAVSVVKCVDFCRSGASQKAT